VLRHTGQNRTFKHNLRLAILLCLNAGFINAAGFIAFNVLTTNVTGHAALLAVGIASSNFHSVRTVALWLLLFLAGAFSSGLIISKVGREKASAYSLPILIIIVVILSVAMFGHVYDHRPIETEYFAGSLLFAMGMQNALVSMVSGSVVRTTHLTGIVTDLGIDLSALITNRKNMPAYMSNRIILRVTIIVSFLLGGIIGGVMFMSSGFHAFFVPACLSATALFYDYFRIKFLRILRK